MIGRSAIAGKTTFCTNLIILLFHLISMHTFKKKPPYNQNGGAKKRSVYFE